ncbi:hypothetical protein [Paenibacillus woosongensis]|uniref:Uncharacterized protein n=1 Tax=Paenibacillus woosongensis TaxID=307580 RepID=A0ABQ4MVB6_9BACL|nr:hypothetical protein [Paenibacillus woosongensis]GIP59879.1 hypothetical protein J15TS10_36930 [Paenibacillus woosongensis]
MAQLPLPIYFTNIVDARKMADSIAYIDISTNRMIGQYFEGEEEQRSLTGFYMEETERQLRFIKSRKNKHVNKVPFRLPKEIKITVKKALIIPLINDAFNDESNFVRGHAHSALDDINMFCS